MERNGFFLFIGNGGGVELAYDDGDFIIPGRIGRPKRIRFPSLGARPGARAPYKFRVRSLGRFFIM